MIKVEDIAYVRFGALDLGSMKQFLTDFGLRVNTGPDGVLYSRGTDPPPYFHVSEPGEASLRDLDGESPSAARLDAAAWPLPPVFRWLAVDGGIAPPDLARTFNCGIGMTMVTAPENAAAAAEMLADLGETVWPVGVIAEGAGGAAGVELAGTKDEWPG